MGYYTRFKLEIENPDVLKVSEHPGTCPTCGHDVIVADSMIKKIREFEFSGCGGRRVVGLLLDGDLDACKWYEHEEDMKDLSTEFPDVIFCLKGVGDNSGDIWKKYFLNGKMQVEKLDLKLPGFDPKKLK